MGYLEIHYEPECTDSVLTCIGLSYGKFLSDLAFTAGSKYKQDDDYPETLFHERMSDLLEDLAEDYLEMPLLFSVELPAPMANLLGYLFRYTFLVTDKELAYYVEGNAPEPINGDYLFSELVNPVFTADGDNVKVKVDVKFIDNQTKATQVSQYELTLHKDSNWKIIN